MHDRFPFVLKWKGKQSGPTANRDVVFYRKALDSLKPCDVSFLLFFNYVVHFYNYYLGKNSQNPQVVTPPTPL